MKCVSFASSKNIISRDTKDFNKGELRINREGLSTKWNKKKSFMIPLREILYLEGSGVIFRTSKGRKKIQVFFFIAVLSTISKNCQWPVFPAFVLPLPHRERGRSIFQNRFFPRLEPVHFLSCPSIETGTKIPVSFLRDD